MRDQITANHQGDLFIQNWERFYLEVFGVPYKGMDVEAQSIRNEFIRCPVTHDVAIVAAVIGWLIIRSCPDNPNRDDGLSYFRSRVVSASCFLRCFKRMTQRLDSTVDGWRNYLPSTGNP